MTRMKRNAAALLLALLPATAGAAELERAPYLQSPTPSSMVVVWTTLDASTGAVQFGLDPDNLDQQVDSAGTQTQHEVALTGLQPDTRYYYRVVGDGEALVGDESHTFLTPPTVGSRSKLRAWVVGDSGTGGQAQANVRDAMLAQIGQHFPDLYLHMGDMAYDTGTYDEFTDNFYAPYATILQRVPVWPTLGNHEGGSSDSGTQSGPYYGGYVLPTAGEAGGVPSGTEAYYAFDHANVHFVVLDSHDSPRDPGGPMLTWLQSDLAATDQEWVIAYWHHPPYTKGSHDSDTEGRLVDMRENALPILEAGGVDLVLGGHSHIYERTFLLDGAYGTPSVAGAGVLDASDGRPNGDGPYTKPPGVASNEGAVYVVAGHGGAGVSQDAEHPLMAFAEAANGSCILDVQGNTLTLFNLRQDGVITDRVAIVKGDGVVVGSPDGGESLGAGTQHEIVWATAGNVPNVRLEYSADDGESWTTIEESIPNTGSFAWTVPVVDTDLALVRVSSPDDPGVLDESNAPFSISSQVELEVIPFGHTWRYHDDDEDLGEAWLALDYDDAAWPSGPGQFGYGDGDEATVLADEDPNLPSAYFRTVVELPEDGELIGAELSALFDDGFAVWINGQQVLGINVDNGLEYGVWASASSEDNETTSATLDPSPFVPGDNVVTAMVKQVSDTSSDLSFDLRLVVTVMLDPPPPGEGDSSSGGSGDAESSAGGDETSGDEAGFTTGPGDGTATASGTDGPGADADGESAGCGCTSGHTAFPWWGLLAIAAFRRRR